MTVPPTPSSERRCGGFDRDRHSRIVARLTSPSVGQCLAYENMIDVPSRYDTFAREHFSIGYANTGIPWPDACPVYALVLMAHGSYRMPDNEAEIETLWQELAPSRLAWRDVREFVADVWRELDRHPELAAAER